MRFQYNYSTGINDLETALSRVAVFLDRHGIQEISELEVRCDPVRDGQRVEAVNGRNEVTVVQFERESEDENVRARRGSYPEDSLTVVERKAGPPRRGLDALLHGYD
jgi:hypothetical protein